MRATRVRLLGWEDHPGEVNDTPLQYSCLENLMDRGAWQATVHGVTRVGHDLAAKLLLLHVCVCVYIYIYIHTYIFQISFLHFSLLVYGNTIDFSRLIMYFATLITLLISTKNYFVSSL